MEGISTRMADQAARHIKGASIAWGGGRIYDFDNPNPEVITLEDAAYALAYTVRWRGQTVRVHRPWWRRALHLDPARCFFGVGQHCVFGAEEMLASGRHPKHALAFLWHEPDEVPLPDMPGPVKPRLPGWREFAHKQGVAVLDRFGIAIPDPDLIKAWDIRMMVTEKRDLLTGHGGDRFHTSHHVTIKEADFPPFARRIIPYRHPDQAARRFLELHHQLTVLAA